MLERFTVDVLADHIDGRLEAAQPSARLSRRFFRTGRKDGRQQLSPASTADFLTDAVDLACSRLAEAYLNEVRAINDGVNALRSRIDVAAGAGPTAAKSDVGAGEGQVGAEAAAGTSAAAAEPEPSGISHEAITAGHSLERSFAVLRERREERQVAERDRLRQGVDDQTQRSRAEILTLDRKRPDLLAVYRQRASSTHAAAALLWSRYCGGYEVGRSKRSSPDDEHSGPKSLITFEMPQVLEPMLREVNTND